MHIKIAPSMGGEAAATDALYPCSIGTEGRLLSQDFFLPTVYIRSMWMHVLKECKRISEMPTFKGKKVLKLVSGVFTWGLHRRPESLNIETQRKCITSHAIWQANKVCRTYHHQVLIDSSLTKQFLSIIPKLTRLIIFAVHKGTGG